MLIDFIEFIASETGLSSEQSRSALGIVINAADRQGSDFSADLFRKIPGARTLSAKTNDEVNGPHSVIARLIEQTPGGRMAVAARMVRDLQKAGLGNREIGLLFPAISRFVEDRFGMNGFGHLGDLMGAGVANRAAVSLAEHRAAVQGR